MANNQFQGSLYRSQRAMLDAIAYAWVGGGGLCGEAERDLMRETTDEALAWECLDGWKLNEAEPGWPGDDDGLLSHMAEQGYTQDDLVDAFGRLREVLENGIWPKLAG